MEAGIADINYSDTLISFIPNMPMDKPEDEPMDVDIDSKMLDKASKQDIDLTMSGGIPHHADQLFPNEFYAPWHQRLTEDWEDHKCYQTGQYSP